MSEQKIIKKQLLKNMMFNLIAFTIIFSIFGMIIYGKVSTSLYKSADTELLNNINRLGIIKEFGETRNQNGKLINMYDTIGQRHKTEINPRLIYVIRDKNGEILDKGNLEKIYSNTGDIKFDIHNINQIYNIILSENYKYRGINYQTEQNGETIYIQILINIDAEENIIENFTETLIISIIMFVLLSIVASYLLSKYTLSPIIKSWRKQTEFVQNASHELRTPLTIIQAKQELLLEEPESKIIDKAQEINISLNETKRLTKLIKDLMTLARADSNDDMIKKEKVKIDDMIKEIVIPYVDFATVQQKKFILDLNYKKEINVDRNKIHQLLVILLDNAIKYTEEKDLIEIKTYEKENKFILEVKDTGIGINEESITHIFDRFYREDKARTRHTGGTGLGLSIAYFIVNAHGGTIKAMHNETKGTMIQIKLPK